MQQILPWESFPLKAYDKLRYADTDRQGHVNNAVFATFLETGRVEMLYQNEGRLIGHGNSYVIASLQLDLVAEINGRVRWKLAPLYLKWAIVLSNCTSNCFKMG